MSEVEFSSPEEGLGEEWVDEVVVKCKGSTDNLSHIFGEHTYAPLLGIH